MIGVLEVEVVRIIISGKLVLINLVKDTKESHLTGINTIQMKEGGPVQGIDLPDNKKKEVTTIKELIGIIINLIDQRIITIETEIIIDDQCYCCSPIEIRAL